MIAIIDYGMGNLASVYKSLQYIGEDAQVTSDPAALLRADAVILPGVGAISNAMQNLRASGVVDSLFEIAHKQKPLLGICLGMQMLFETSEECASGTPGDRAEGLGLLKGQVTRLPDLPSIKIPHMGWNQLTQTKGTLYREDSFVYFVHSYRVVPDDPGIVTSTTFHGVPFTSSIAQGAICGMQFHPEKSGETGLAILRAWVKSTKR